VANIVLEVDGIGHYTDSAAQPEKDPDYVGVVLAV
jgi:hypothetical protein